MTGVLVTSLALQSGVFDRLFNVFKNRAERRLPKSEVEYKMSKEDLEKTTRGSKFSGIWENTKQIFSPTKAWAEESGTITPQMVSEWLEKKQVAGRSAPVTFNKILEVGFVEKWMPHEEAIKNWEKLEFGTEIRVFRIDKGKRWPTPIYFDCKDFLSAFGLKEFGPYARIVMTGGNDKETQYAVADKGMDGVLHIRFALNPSNETGFDAIITSIHGPPFKLSEKFFLAGTDDAILAVDIKQKRFIFTGGDKTQIQYGKINIERSVDGAVFNSSIAVVMSNLGLVIIDWAKNSPEGISVRSFKGEPPPKNPFVVGEVGSTKFAVGAQEWNHIYTFTYNGTLNFKGEFKVEEVDIFKK